MDFFGLITLFIVYVSRIRGKNRKSFYGHGSSVQTKLGDRKSVSALHSFLNLLLLPNPDTIFFDDPQITGNRLA